MTTRFKIERADNGGYIVLSDDVRQGYANYPAAALSSAEHLLDWLRYAPKSPLKEDLKPASVADVMAQIRREHPELFI